MWEVARVSLAAALNSARELGSDTPDGGRPGIVIGPDPQEKFFRWKIFSSSL